MGGSTVLDLLGSTGRLPLNQAATLRISHGPGFGFRCKALISFGVPWPFDRLTRAADLDLWTDWQ
jgi:hypothetical protein